MTGCYSCVHKRQTIPLQTCQKPPKKKELNEAVTLISSSTFGHCKSTPAPPLQAAAVMPSMCKLSRLHKHQSQWQWRMLFPHWCATYTRRTTFPCLCKNHSRLFICAPLPPPTRLQDIDWSSGKRNMPEFADRLGQWTDPRFSSAGFHQQQISNAQLGLQRGMQRHM